MSTPDFSQPDAKCDLIMQGGITSGVVYPTAVLKLAAKYRFRSIGGTSAGAIAAAVAAAAECSRESGGFERLATVPKKLSECLLSLFQPARPFRGLFAIFTACLGERSKVIRLLRGLAVAVRHFPLTTFIGLAPAIIYLVRTGHAWHTARMSFDALEWIGVVMAMAVGVLLAWLVRLIWIVVHDLPRTCFGVCPGLRQGGRREPALTEWLADLLDELAGRGAASSASPLTFGDLDARGIELKMMTTNLSMRRPYSLPFVMRDADPQRDGRYAFNEEEWRGYFPGRVMSWLHDNSLEVTDHPGYRYLPDPQHLPVVVAVRMSLSFPILLSAVPLYRPDRTYRDPIELQKLRRCIFSDGGISSNFPIHFFDNLLPTRPTFAIALEEYCEARQGDDTPENRVYMPAMATTGFLLPIERVDTLVDFVVGILDSARTWQDSLQRLLAGYRERTTHIALTAEEGGLNLTMDSDRIKRLTELGGIAGDRMLDFNLPEHQWRRFLVAYARLEESFEHMNSAYQAGFEHFLEDYPSEALSYKQTQQWIDAARERVKRLLELTAPWTEVPLRKSGHIPKPDTDLRITPKP